MIKGIGIDLIEISRIKEAVEKFGQTFLKRIYTPSEIKYCTQKTGYRFSSLAVRFAAKEAYAKAIGTGMAGINWTQIEVKNYGSGKPYLLIKGKKAKRAHISLSHTHKLAIAQVVIE